LKKH